MPEPCVRARVGLQRTLITCKLQPSLPQFLIAMTQTTAFPTPTEFFIDTGLYSKVAVPEGKDELGQTLVFKQGPIDAFCPGCGSHSIFNRVPFKEEPYQRDAWAYNRRLILTFQCSRAKDHNLTFWLQIDSNDRTIQKIGQFPSVADLNTHDVRKYRNVLNKEAFVELTRSIGLAAHGVGVGSFVYLRRIFESLVEEAHSRAVQDQGWDENGYREARMDDKIRLLSHLLPRFLVEHRSLYGILSKGVHELSEDECLAAFPVVKAGIEIILDDKLRIIAEQKKIAEATKAIQALASVAKK